ncbi:ABC transporter substrate-binding protein [Shewanella aestuarii]|uniref:Sugar ABC transporter n=1 Tax=Shewanella aestuarii TaxID=1028752 RepID=A0A6G9QQ20_9GAMM|nr:sugar ABC transporter [Shewanella aestuarii]QIR15911.1 sugar ABC transporter [Shewanella aestuarii]
MMLRSVLLVFCFIFNSVYCYGATILVIKSYHAENPWDTSYKQALEAALNAEHDMFYFEMDTKRLPESQYLAQADAAWQLYNKLKPALVILGDDNALKYMGPKLTATQTPVVYLGINANPRNYGVTQKDQISGVLERPLLKRSMVMLNAILPIKKLLVLFDSASTSKVIREDSFNNQDSLTLNGIQIDLKFIDNYSQWQSLVLSAKQQNYDAMIVGLYQALFDDSGNHVDPEQVIEWTSTHAQVPPFGFWDFSVGEQKTIGGFVISGYEQGLLASQIALQMLAGKHAIKIQTSEQGHFLFSKNQLAKWKIVLPPEIDDKSEKVN